MSILYYRCGFFVFFLKGVIFILLRIFMLTTISQSISEHHQQTFFLFSSNLHFFSSSNMNIYTALLYLIIWCSKNLLQVDKMENNQRIQNKIEFKWLLLTVLNKSTFLTLLTAVMHVHVHFHSESDTCQINA